MAATAPTEAPAYYLVLEAPTEGPVEIVHAGVVSMPRQAPLSEPQVQARARTAPRDTSVVSAVVTDASGNVVFRDAIPVPRWMRGEFHATTPAGPAIDGRIVTPNAATFVVRVPRVDGGTLHLDGGPVREPATFALDAVATDSRLALPSAARTARTVQAAAADSGNRVDLLILGDGYTEAERSLFEEHVQRVRDEFFAITPYREYRNYVNVTALFTPSAESGADQPPFVAGCRQGVRAPTCCGQTGGGPARFVNTAFDATFCSYDTQRLLTVDSRKILTAASTVPDWDEILIVVNSATYGGSGGGFSTFSVHALAIDIARHEYGHSFTGLADEYSTPYPGYPACSDISGPPCEANVTDVTARDQIKWNRWIAASQAVPSTGAPPRAEDAGLWQGARYQSTGMFRQGFRCLMNVLGAPFGDVASEAYALRLYRGGWGAPSLGIRNIEPGTASPAGAVTVPVGSRTTFSAQVLGPVEGPPVQVTWRVDGAVVSAGTAANGSAAAFALDATTAGTFVVSLEVIDVSPILHPTMRAGLASRHSWTVTVTPPPPQTLTVVLAGTGNGRVISSPNGIDCPSVACTAAYPAGTRVTLTAAAGASSRFVGWSGCTGSDTCAVTMDAARDVTAEFARVAAADTYWIEAEDVRYGDRGSITSPLRIVDAAGASSGSFVTVEGGRNSTTAAPALGHTCHSVDLETSATYRIWGRVLGAGSSDASFWLRVDEEGWMPWTFSVGGDWHWDHVHQPSTPAEPALFTLDAGPHQVCVAYREDGAQLDALVVTSRADFDPRTPPATTVDPPQRVDVLGGPERTLVSWTNVPGATRYTVLRRVGDGPPIPHAEVPGHTFSEGGLANGTAYCYAVVAHTASAASGRSVERCATPAAAYDSVTEPEGYSLTAPMQVSGEGIEVAPGNDSPAMPPKQGWARYDFRLAAPLNVKVWGVVRAPSPSDDSFWVRMDGGRWINWNGIRPRDPLAPCPWDDVHDSAAGGTRVTFALAAGSHSLEIAYREDGTRLDRVLVTNDLSRVVRDCSGAR